MRDRITTFLREREWSKAAFELLIVALGVLLGIQASNWNDERLRRERQVSVLKQIGEQLNQTVVEADERVAFSRRTLHEIGVVIGVAETGKLLPADDAKFRSGLNLLDGWWKPAWRLGVIDELIAQGELDLIRDANLRAGLIAYRDTVMVIRGDIEMMMSDVYHHMPTVIRDVRFEPTAAVDNAKTEGDLMASDLFRVDVDPAKLHNPEVASALSAIRRDQLYALGNQIIVRDEARRLRDLLNSARR